MNAQTSPSVASTALLVSLTYVPLLLSVLSFYPEFVRTHPVQRFFLGLAPWWLAYLSARWYIRLAERSSPLYHPFGCLAQCFIWVFHWVVSLYHAFFGMCYTILAVCAFQVFCLLSFKSPSTPCGRTSSPYFARVSWSSQRAYSTALSR